MRILLSIIGLLWTSVAVGAHLLPVSQTTQSAESHRTNDFQYVDGNSHGEAAGHQVGDSRYSLFMHHASGYALFAVGIVTLYDRLTSRRYATLRTAAGIGWIAIGIFIFIWADPEGWPLAGSLTESWHMPTSGEWLQHKILSLIPMGLGLSAIATAFRARLDSAWNYALAVLAVIGAVGLLAHQHRNHPGMDIVNLQHTLFAFTALLTAVSLIQEVWKGWNWTRKELLYPACLLLLGLQLTLYVE